MYSCAISVPDTGPALRTVAVTVSSESNLLIVEDSTLTAGDEYEKGNESEEGILSSLFCVSDGCREVGDIASSSAATLLPLIPPLLMIKLLYWKVVYDRP